MRTTPGHTVQNSKFSIKFESATQKGKESHLLEFQTDWSEVMDILLNNLSRQPASPLCPVEMQAAQELEAWALAQDGGEELQLRCRVNVADLKYYRATAVKNLWLYFNDQYKTIVMFTVVRKRELQPLVGLAASRVADQLTAVQQSDRLELPRDILPDLRAAYTDPWRTHKLDSSPRKKRVSQMTVKNLRKMKNCPYCGKKNFKKVLAHVVRSHDCHVKHKAQIQYNYVVNKCFW